MFYGVKKDCQYIHDLSVLENIFKSSLLHVTTTSAAATFYSFLEKNNKKPNKLHTHSYLSKHFKLFYLVF